MGDESTTPITLEYKLRCDADRAFATYADRIGDWWDPRYSRDADTFEGVTIEPHIGGHVYASHGDDGTG